MPTVYRHSREDLPAITRVASRGIQHSPTWCIVPRQNGHILNALPLPAAHAVGRRSALDKRTWHQARQWQHVSAGGEALAHGRRHAGISPCRWYVATDRWHVRADNPATEQSMGYH